MFNPTSTYEGSLEKGGIICKIVDNILYQFVSIQNDGLTKADKGITEGPEVEKWANGFEYYTI